jgi:hypothetical protein
MSKSISSFLPVSKHPQARSERHYVQVHVPFARRLLLAKPQVISYHTNRARSEYDLNGRWRQRPNAWRFVVLRFEEGQGLGFTEEERRVVSNDHRNCLRGLRGCPVTEEVLHDRLAGQTSLAKYLFEFDRYPTTPFEEARERARELGTEFLARAGSAFGIRRISLNLVDGEAETGALDEEGQLITGRLLPETDKVAFLEVYFDHEEWGDGLFAQDGLRELLVDPFFAVARGYKIDERCGLDRRGG